jgi:hypothetical protein
MEPAWHEHELCTTFSLALVRPQALMSLRETGQCFVNLAEALFDVDHAGDYMRRLKTVSLTIPSVGGTYTGVRADLVLLGSEIRMTDDPNEPPVKYRGAVKSIGTSIDHNDAGVFELTLADERYLPFEGQGAVNRSG